MKSPNLLSQRRLKFLREQGYITQSDREISLLAWGNRFAYILCTLILGAAVGFANLPLLVVMFIIATLGILLPYHPFDYIYNEWLSRLMRRPQLPKRSDQLKFACTIASVLLLTDIYLFYHGFTIAGYAIGGLLFVVAFTVSTTDYCLPSAIYNHLILRSVRRSLKNFK